MKKAEAISILATSVRPREAKDRARYDEAVKMAIEALKCSETPKSSERTAETAQNVQNEDLISQKSAIDALDEQIEQCNKALGSFDISTKDEYAIKVERASLKAYKEKLENMPSAQPDNQINLCDSCDYLYPECPSEKDDVIFGNGIGNDNICACNKYQPTIQPEIVKCKGCEYFRIIDYNELECVHPELRVYTPDFEFGCISEKRRTDEK